MRAEIISVGTELLLGHCVNTNAAYLSRELARLGIDSFYQTTVGDNQNRLLECLIRSFSRADIVITTGGLGPTIDDITCETISRFIGKKLVLNRTILKQIKKHFKGRGFKTPPDSLRQAYIPRGAEWLKNRVGTAPGLIIENKHNAIIALPGPPRELQPMFEERVISYLKKNIKDTWTIKSRVIKTTGLAESQVHKKVRDLLRLGPNPTVGIYARLGEVDLKITSKASSEKKASRAISKIEKEIRRRLKDYIFGFDNDTLEGTIANILRKRRKTLAIAESCTGGLLSNRLTDVSESSKYFTMGVVAYSNKAKVEVLGVSENTIKERGAVSKDVALEMVRGISLISDADIGIGITGIAGPTGGTKSKPVGLVYIALLTKRNKFVKEFRFKGTRGEIKFQTSQAALDMIRKNVY